MPAPAPCANTRHALDWAEQSNTPDTLTDSPTAIVTCCGAVVVTRVVCPRIRFVSPMPETGHERYGRLIHIFGKKTPGGGRFMAQYHGSKGGNPCSTESLAVGRSPDNVGTCSRKTRRSWCSHCCPRSLCLSCSAPLRCRCSRCITASNPS